MDSRSGPFVTIEILVSYSYCPEPEIRSIINDHASDACEAAADTRSQ
jgi:hypothetical protein